MDGMLSQDEINALLNGVDLSADSGASDTATATSSAAVDGDLTEIEKDAIGEVVISVWEPLPPHFFHLLIER